jgi:hypothetical protein
MKQFSLLDYLAFAGLLMIVLLILGMSK